MSPRFRARWQRGSTADRLEWTMAQGPRVAPGSRRVRARRRRVARARQPAAATAGLVARVARTWRGAPGSAPCTLAWRTLAGVVTPGAGVPAQYLSIFGGPVSAPGYGFHSLAGRAGCRAARRVPVAYPVHLNELRKVRPGAVELWWSPRTSTESGSARGRGSAAGLFPSVGIGLLSVFDLMRVDVARALRGGAVAPLARRVPRLLVGVLSSFEGAARPWSSQGTRRAGWPVSRS